MKPAHRTYIIAEIGPNHNGSLAIALQMVERLALAGADAVKFQISRPELVYSKDAFKVDYQKRTENSASPIEMSKKYQMPYENYVKLREHCVLNNVDFLCSAFDRESLEFLLANCNVPYLKIPSGEIFSIDTLEIIRKRKEPIILSTGMAEYGEIDRVIGFLNEFSRKEIILMHCVSKYPAECKDMNLNVMHELRDRFGYSVGLSDHTTGMECAVVAVGMGAVMIEKHVTSDRGLPGPDHQASLTIEDFGKLVGSIRDTELALGSREKIFSEEEKSVRQGARKSIVAARDMKVGECIHEEDICFKRPGIGISPMDMMEVIGRKAIQPIERDRVIMPEWIESEECI